MSNRPSTARILGRFALAVLLLAGASAGWATWSTSRAWADMTSTSARLVEAAAAARPSRVLLRPPLHEGNAWVDYEASLADPAAALTRSQHMDLDHFVLSDVDALRSPAGVLWERGRPALARLWRGARCDRLEIPDLSVRLRDGDPPGFQALPGLLKLGLVDARGLLVNQRDPAAAVQRWIDLLQICRDWVDASAGVAASQAAQGVRWVVLSVGRALRDGSLPPSALAELERALENLDAEPASLDLLQQRELAYVGAELSCYGLRGCLERHGDPQAYYGTPGWRHIYSERRLAASFFAYYRASLAGQQGSRAWTGDRHRAYWASVCQPEPALCFILGFPGWTAASWRTFHAGVRVLRTGVRFARLGEKLELADPCGDTLRLTVQPGLGLLEVRSAGFNGSYGQWGGDALFVRVRIR
jgi:hypothetical protein